MLGLPAQNLKTAPPVAREFNQLMMGVASVGTAPFELVAGMGELGNSYNQVGPAQTALNVATGLIDHVIDYPIEFGASVMTGLFVIRSSPSGSSAKDVAAANTGVVNPAELRWSQTTAGGSGRAAKYREALARDGWKEGEFIDVVRTPDGLVTVDHTRAAVALELKMT